MKKHYYTIGEVCNLLELKPHVLRYWEKEFSYLQPKKNKARNRRYSIADIDLLKKIKYMLYEQKFTINGAQKKLKEERKTKVQLEINIPDQKTIKKDNLKKSLLEIKELLKV